MRLSQGNKMANRPGDDVTATMQKALPLLTRTENAGDVAGNGGLFGNYGSGWQSNLYFSGGCLAAAIKSDCEQGDARQGIGGRLGSGHFAARDTGGLDRMVIGFKAG